MISFDNHIILDQVNTWPPEIINIIRENEGLLKAFLDEKRRINKLSRADILARFNLPKNIHDIHWEQVVWEIENILVDHSIVGIHATRLIDAEITDIQQNGLKPLEREFSNQRVYGLFNQGLITRKLLDELVDKEELTEDCRAGKSFVFHCLSTLKDELGLNKLFGFWGGEALYAYIHNAEELATIGSPCIVFVSIPVKELDFYTKLSDRMISFYFDSDPFGMDTDSSFEKSLKVLQVIKRDEEIFEELTNIQNWDSPVM